MKTKVYLVKGYHGDGYDGFDYILGSYFDKDKAEKRASLHNEFIEAEIERAKKCEQCPVCGYDISIKKENSKEKFSNKMEQKCDYAKIDFYDDGSPKCLNRLDMYEALEEGAASIEEIEII